ncbi:hypothetical protein ACQPYE_28320 [Actinosynnema sp. CA-299493]
MGEVEKQNPAGGGVAEAGKAAKIAQLAAGLERKAALIRQEVRVDMRISEIVAEAEIEQDRLERG